MFSTLVRWELRAVGRHASFWAATAFAGLAIGFALANGAAWFSHLAELQATARRVDRQTAAEARAKATRLELAPDPSVIPTYDPRNPYGYAYFQMQHSAALPAAPLAALTTGQSDVLPQVLPLNPGPVPTMLGASDPENPNRLLTGPFDVSFVVVSLLPLLIVGLCYGLLGEDREKGTLPLLLAQPVALRRVVAARMVPRLLLVGALLAALGAGFRLFVPAEFSPPRLLLWLSIASAYCAFWFALGFLIVTRRGSPAAHALILAVLWLALVVLVPAGINAFAKAAFPVPSRLELILAMREATDGISAHTGRLLAGYYEDHPELAPKAGASTEYSEIRFITNETLKERLSPVLARYDEQLERQQLLVEKLQYLSPALLVHSALADAAGTGAARHRAFMTQAAEHHARLQAFFNPRILRKEKFAAWDEVPDFTFIEEPFPSLAARILPAVLALLAAAAALARWAWLSLRRNPLTS